MKLSQPETGTTPDTQPQPPAGAIVHPSCGNWWTGLSRAHCPACHQTFSTDSAADKHRRGPHGPDRHCVDPATVGLIAVQKPYGLLWQNPAPEGGYDHLRRIKGDPDDGAETAGGAA